MSNVVHLRVPTALLGRWRSEQDDERSEYLISHKDGELIVFAFDFVDGEQYLISNVQCDQETVTFDTLMPSTGRRGHIILKSTSEPGRAVQTFTFTDEAALTRLPK